MNLEFKKPQTFISMMKHITDDMLTQQLSVMSTMKEVNIFIEGWLKGRQNREESKFFFTKFLEHYCLRQHGCSLGEKGWWSDFFLEWAEPKTKATEKEKNAEAKRLFASMWRGFLAVTPQDQWPWEYSPEKHKSPYIRSIDDSGRYGEDSSSVDSNG